MKDLDIKFPLDKFDKLIIDIGWESLDDWFNFWNNQNKILSISFFQPYPLGSVAKVYSKSFN